MMMSNCSNNGRNLMPEIVGNVVDLFNVCNFIHLQCCSDMGRQNLVKLLEMLLIFLMCVFTFNVALTWADRILSKDFTAPVSSSTMPLPFSRVLYLTTTYLSGNDVTIAQNLLARDDYVDGRLSKDGVFGEQSEQAVLDFQRGNNLSPTGILDSSTAELLLTLHSADGYKDSDFTASSLGYKYKFHIPVYQNRSIETKATLYDGDN